MLAIIQLKNTKLGQMTYLNVIFHMVVLFYEFVKISKSSRPSPLLKFKVANFMLHRRFFVKYLSSFGQNTA